MFNRKCITIMKKLFYSILAAAALVACAKEKEAQIEVAKAPVPTHKETIVATFSAETKTAYSEYSKFAWEAGDQIWVGVVKNGASNPLNSNYYEYVLFTAKSAGTTVEFEGEVPDTYRPNSAHIAFYPGTAQDPWYESGQSGFACRLPNPVCIGTAAPEGASNAAVVAADNPLGFLPLIGSLQTDGSFAFSTGVGVLKFQFTDLPAETCSLTIKREGGCMSNYFIVDSDGYVKADKVLARGTSTYGNPSVVYYFTPAADGTATVFVATPVGTMAAGTSISIADSKGEELFSKEFASAVTVERNKIVPLAPIKAKFDWESLGTGKFIDSFLWRVASFSGGYVDVEIEKNAEGQFRLNPYKAAAEAFSYTPEGTVSGPVPVVLKPQEGGYIYYDETPSGIYGGSYEYAISAPYYWSSNYPSYYGSYGKGNNFVAKYKADGTPANIILSPVYTSVTTSSFTADNYIWANTIQVVFPGASEVDIAASLAFVEIADDSASDPIATFVVEMGADIASISIAAAATPEEALAAIEAGEGVTVVTASGQAEVHLPANSPSGNYYAVGKVVAADGMTALVNRTITSAPFHYDNPDADLGLDESVLYGEWTGSIVWFYSNAYHQDETFSITLGESDSFLEGNILVTNFMGYPGNGKGYMSFNTATGALTIPDDTPIATVDDTRHLGMQDANGDGNGEFVFRYDPDAKTLTLEDIFFVGFELYNASDGSDTKRWLGYCYGSDGVALVLTKAEAASSAPSVGNSRNFSAPSRLAEPKTNCVKAK